MVPWAHLDSPTVTQTLRSCDCQGRGNVEITKANRVVWLQDRPGIFARLGFGTFPISDITTCLAP